MVRRRLKTGPCGPWNECGTPSAPAPDRQTHASHSSTDTVLTSSPGLGSKTHAQAAARTTASGASLTTSPGGLNTRRAESG